MNSKISKILKKWSAITGRPYHLSKKLWQQLNKDDRVLALKRIDEDFRRLNNRQ
jgi:hypothetical protein